MVFRRWIFLACVVFWGRLEAAEPYAPKAEISIEDRWRWHEIEALSGYQVRGAAEAPDGALWFARREGAIRYDGRELTVFDFDDEGVEWVRDIFVSQAGVVYLFGDRYLAALENGVWRVLSRELGDDSFGNLICETSGGDIWVGQGGSMVRYRDGVATAFQTELSRIGSCVIDHDDHLWVADVAENRVEVYETRGLVDGGLLTPMRSLALGGNSNFWTELLVDSEGQVLAVNPDEEGRSFRFDLTGGELAVEGMEDGGLLSGQLSIAETQPGRLWFCRPRQLREYWDGVWTQYEVEDLPLPTSYSFMVGLSGNRLLIGGRVSKTYIIDLSDRRWTDYRNLNLQCEDKDGSQWFLAHDGRVVEREPDGDSWTAFDQEDGVIDAPNRIFASSDGTIWVSGAHEGAAAVAYREGGIWKRARYPRAAKTFSHLSAAEASDGSVLFGAGTPELELGSRKGGAVVFSKVDGVYEGTHVSPPIFPRRTANIVERAGDGFWFGAASLTRRLGKGTLAPERVEQFNDNWIDHMILDAENNLWVALWGIGLYRFDGVDWTRFSEVNGLPSNHVVYLLKVGESVWVATGEGLSRYDGRSWSRWDFSPNVAFQRENNTLVATKDGSIWMNYAYRSWLLEGRRDASHAAAFHTVRYRPDDLAPETRIVDRDTKVPEGSQLEVSWNGSDVWGDTPTAQLDYSWRLNGGEWSPFGRDRNLVLQGLAGGRHHFEVRARDRDWNVDPAPASVWLQVILPVWKRPWFIMLSVAVVGLIVYLANALFKARVRAALAMEEFKLDFFTNISHELRNPLAVIVGPLESLLRKEEDSDSRGVLQIALRNARKMQGLVDQLLQFRKLELGMALYRPARGEIVGFLRDAIEAAAPLWQARGHRVECDFDPDYFECFFDADKLQKIFDNLFSNAIKYTPDGGVITVRLRLEGIDGQVECLLQVEDTGVGIPQHELDLVAQPFYRVKGGKGTVEGFGIGLALVGELVKLWGGTLTLESPVGEERNGILATVRLPLAEEAAEAAELELEEDDLLFPEADEGGRKGRSRVLLVEDNADLRRFLSMELSDRFEIRQAEDGVAGLEAAIQADPDLIITDVMMPGMNGFELCRELRADSRTSHIPIIILTAKSSEEHSVEGIKAGADAFFPKPLNILHLLARMEHLLESRRQLKRKFAEQLVIEPTELTVTSTDEAILRKAIKVVEDNMSDETFGVEHFAKEMAMSRATLYRKLKALTGEAPNPFIRTMRLKRAAQMLKTGRMSVSGTLEHVGILDLSYFSRVFKSQFGEPPSDFAARYREK